MFPVMSDNTKYWSGSSPAYTGSSPYAIPDQPPFANQLSRHHSQWKPSGIGATPSPPSYNNSNTRTERISSSRKGSVFSERSTSSSSLLNKSRSNSNDSTLSRLSSSSSSSDNNSSSSSSFTSNLRTLLSRASESSEERRARKAEKQRQLRIQQAERAAYERAQEMEATALYMAWRYGEGPNTVSYAMY